MSMDDKAQRAIDDVFGDTSVPQAETAARLQELKGHIEILLDSLEEED